LGVAVQLKFGLETDQVGGGAYLQAIIPFIAMWASASEP